MTHRRTFPVSALAILLFACNRYETVSPECDDEPPIVPSNITWRTSDTAGVISGSALDAHSLKPASGTLIEIRPGNHHAVTDATGAFHFDSMSAGHYEMLARRIGYAPGRMNFKLTKSAGIEVSVQMQASLTQLDGCGYVMIRKRKPWWKP
jgi:hypothetical protein